MNEVGIISVSENKLEQYIQRCVEKNVKEIVTRLFTELDIYSPQYTQWGRWLKPKQAAIYCGFKSTKGLKSLCNGKYTPPKNNERVVLYDREELDKVVRGNYIDNYLKELR